MSTEPDYEIEYRWKEQVFYWEGSRGLHFDGGWGIRPFVTYFPSAARWPEVVPEWAIGKRDLVLQRLIDDGPTHRVEVTDVYSYPVGVTR